MIEYNDYELVMLAQNGNDDAINIIYNKYKPLILYKSKYALGYINHHGIDINDIMQEGFIGLDDAIRKFCQDNGATFYTFASICINREIFNYIKKSVREKDKILNNAISIDDTLESIISDDTNIELDFFNKDDELNIISKVKDKLTFNELRVLNLRIEGYSFDEIANTLNKDVKSIYNTFHRIKLKFKKIIEIIEIDN